MSACLKRSYYNCWTQTSFQGNDYSKVSAVHKYTDYGGISAFNENTSNWGKFFLTPVYWILFVMNKQWLRFSKASIIYENHEIDHQKQISLRYGMTICLTVIDRNGAIKCIKFAQTRNRLLTLNWFYYSEFMIYYYMWPLSPTWFNFNPGIDR